MTTLVEDSDIIFSVLSFSLSYCWMLVLEGIMDNMLTLMLICGICERHVGGFAPNANVFRIRQHNTYILQLFPLCYYNCVLSCADTVKLDDSSGIKSCRLSRVTQQCTAYAAHHIMVLVLCVTGAKLRNEFYEYL